VKRALEYVSDRQNVTSSYTGGMVWHLFFAVLARASRYGGDRVGMDGSWSGNDTIWRTCLDLNRILLYGRADGTMSDEMQRRVIHIADAVIAGQGNGPLAPEPLDLGLLIGGATQRRSIGWARNCSPMRRKRSLWCATLSIGFAGRLQMFPAAACV